MFLKIVTKFLRTPFLQSISKQALLQAAAVILENPKRQSEGSS